MRVLIIEDNIELANIMHDCLDGYRKIGIDVVGVAYDGLEGLRMIFEREPDVALLDVVMPKLDGIGVLRAAHDLRLKKKTHFVMFSAIGMDTIVRQAMALGAERYIAKPYSIDALVLMMQEMVS